MSALYLTMNMLIEPGDEVIAIGPVWPNIYSTVEIHGGVVRHASVELVDGEWRLDLDRMFALASERPQAIFVNSSGKQTGPNIGVLREEVRVGQEGVSKCRYTW